MGHGRRRKTQAGGADLGEPEGQTAEDGTPEGMVGWHGAGREEQGGAETLGK